MVVVFFRRGGRVKKKGDRRGDVAGKMPASTTTGALLLLWRAPSLSIEPHTPHTHRHTHTSNSKLTLAERNNKELPLLRFGKSQWGQTHLIARPPRQRARARPAPCRG